MFRKAVLHSSSGWSEARAVRSSETLVSYHIIIRRLNPEDQDLIKLHSEDGRSKVLRNVGILPHHYTVSQPRRPGLITKLRSEDGRSKVLRNVGIISQDYMAPQPEDRDMNLYSRENLKSCDWNTDLLTNNVVAEPEGSTPVIEAGSYVRLPPSQRISLTSVSKFSHHLPDLHSSSPTGCYPGGCNEYGPLW
jgi:uncharacterized protein Veg